MTIAAVVLLLLAAYFRSVPLLAVAGLTVLLSLAASRWLAVIGRSLRVDRAAESHLFFGDTATVVLSIANRSRLPVPWLELHESLPAALVLPNVLSRVVAIRSRGRAEIRYELRGRRRGAHLIGPLTLRAGDPFGLARCELRVANRQTIVVYPKILAAEQLRLPALLLFGDLRARRLYLGDPARMAGSRPYSAGDALHDVHWRATAATGTLQVKQYQPSTTLQSTIYLDLRGEAYGGPGGTAVELAISVAATAAHWLTEQRQAVGLVTNGAVPFASQDTDVTVVPAAGGSGAAAAAAQPTTAIPMPLAATRGRGQLIRLLELLARIEPVRGGPPPEALLRPAFGLPWGSTLVLITGEAGDDLYLLLHRLRQCGLVVVVFMVARPADPLVAEQRARALGIRLHIFWQEQQFEAYAS